MNDTDKQSTINRVVRNLLPDVADEFTPFPPFRTLQLTPFSKSSSSNPHFLRVYLVSQYEWVSVHLQRRSLPPPLGEACRGVPWIAALLPNMVVIAPFQDPPINICRPLTSLGIPSPSTG